MKYPLNAEIMVEPDTIEPVFSWEVVRSETDQIKDKNALRYLTVEELRITVPVDMKTRLAPGLNVSVDGGNSWWRVESNPHEVAGGWGWTPGLVIVLATRKESS